MGGSGADSTVGLAAEAAPSTLRSPLLLRTLLRSGSRLVSCGRRCNSSRCGLPRSRVAMFATLAAAVAAFTLVAASLHATGRLAATRAAPATSHSLSGDGGSRSRHSGSAAALRQPQQRPCHEACPLPRRCYASAGASGARGADLRQIVNASLGRLGGHSRRANDSVHRRNYRFLCAPKNPCPLSASLPFPLPTSSTFRPPLLQTGSGASGRPQLPLGGSRRRSLWWAVFVVTSAAANVEQRAAIRDTWARSAARLGMRVVFLVGLTPDSRVLAALSDEWARHGDLIVGDFPDSYDLLTVKSVAMLRWAQLECSSRARYLIKIDDDMFVSVPHLLVVLRAHAGKRRAIIGARRDRLRVELRPNHKWRDPLFVKHYGSLRYPTYMSGTAYVIAMPLVGDLFAASQAEPFDRMEDVFVTGLCARRAGNVTHVRHGGFTASHRRACSYASPLTITGHHVSPSEMRWLWSKLVANAACKPDYRPGESLERNDSSRPATLPPLR